MAAGFEANELRSSSTQGDGVGEKSHNVNLGATKMPRGMQVSLVACTVVRILFVLGILPSGLTRLLKSPSFTSALVNPLHTFEHLREGNFLMQLSGGLFKYAYKGHAFRSPPLLLVAFQPLLSLQPRASQDIMIGLIITLVDVGVALYLYKVSQHCIHSSSGKDESKLELGMHERIRPARAWVFGIKFDSYPVQLRLGQKQNIKRDDDSTKEETKANDHDKNGEQSDENEESQVHRAKPSNPIPVFEPSILPQLCCLFYYANPVTILASFGSDSQSFQSIFYLLFLLAVHEVLGGTKNQGGSQDKKINVPLSVFYLALASYVETYSFVYLIPVSLMAGNALGNTAQAVKSCCSYFLLWSCILHAMTFVLVGSDWIKIQSKIYGDAYYFSNLSPNLGMHWYFFIQMFDRFRSYFVVLLNGLPFIFVVPLSIRIHAYPIPLATSLFALGVLFKPVITCHDFSMVLALFLMSPRTLSRMGNASLVSTFAVFVPVALYMMDYWLWLETGSGNANYMYFQCLAFSTFLGILTLDFTSATLKRDKALRLTEKEQKQGKGQ